MCSTLASQVCLLHCFINREPPPVSCTTKCLYNELQPGSQQRARLKPSSLSVYYRMLAVDPYPPVLVRKCRCGDGPASEPWNHVSEIWDRSASINYIITMWASLICCGLHSVTDGVATGYDCCCFRAMALAARFTVRTGTGHARNLYMRPSPPPSSHLLLPFHSFLYVQYSSSIHYPLRSACTRPCAAVIDKAPVLGTGRPISRRWCGCRKAFHKFME